MPRLPEPAPLKVATLAYPVGEPRSWEEFEAKAAAFASEAAGAGARFLVFPEYFAMELAALFPDDVRGSLKRQLVSVQETLPAFRSLFSRLAREHGTTIVAGTYPVALGDGYRNRSYVYLPDGSEDFQDKLIMTRFENELWHIGAGDALRVFDTGAFKFGVNICYDSEFPGLARRQAESGAHMLAVPSCTDTRAGDYRVRVGARARALENQFFVMRSPTVGVAPWSPAIDENTGCAAIYSTCDREFPADGVVASGADETPGWVYGELDLARVDWIRRHGQVLNFADRLRQDRFGGNSQG